MLEFILDLIRRHIFIAMMLPFAIVLTGHLLTAGDFDDENAVSQIATLMHKQDENGGGRVQSFTQIANRMNDKIHSIMPLANDD
ncbi:hypothetical protein [Acidithiobacillus thiooxidans]|uniref:hypothetical protein n=1 Tax=Acidithiobacillus thiooxidans TaxID=930 RepID=UPI001C0752A7|nr:hypothetical protein [Acidithiobacillus thiooxidans]MBU2843571.1 hypothetical protein [Acidithiobacillus thiooxidans]